MVSPDAPRRSIPGMLGWVRRHGGGVRIRLTVIATVLVALALAAAGAIVLLLLHRSLMHNATNTTAAKTSDIAAAIAPHGVAGADLDGLLAPGGIDVIQIVDDRGAVIAADPAHRGYPPLAGGRPAPGHTEQVEDADFPNRDTDYRGTIRGVATPQGPVWVIAGIDEDPLDRTVITVAILLCVAFPVILLLVVAAVYWFVGRALRPVDSITARVGEISSSDLSQRVPMPPGSDEIAMLATTMNDMLSRLDESQRRQRQFVGDASHELRSPLTTLVGILDLARNTKEPIDIATVDDVLLPEAHRLQGLVDDLLTLARSDEQRLLVEPVDVDLDDVVSDEIRRAEPLLGVEPAVTIAAARVRGDRAALGRAIRNLIDNASRYNQGHISIHMSTDSATVSVAVSDDGPGIADADKERVLRRFVRLDDDRGRAAGAHATGTGLGLSIVDEIVRAHGGSVRVGDTPGGGATFTITLPRQHG
ncbi:sensor histidine kinase [Jongsikchunia kroppenstedtii]|uniref:sensor histidine kinase n=1 Tax=Jongsikchunia kroppenstedtii TaxID=1121721 RepID=UPI0003A61712|nr:HAMP domain-containing sensor histidine kinase [Jongsikchunia kroppenstedtii]